MPLTDARCRSAQPGPRLQKLTDGGGLQLWLQPTGARLWRFAYRFDGKQKLLALGVYPTFRWRALGRRGRTPGAYWRMASIRRSIKSAGPGPRRTPRRFAASPTSMSRSFGERSGQRQPWQRSNGSSALPTRSLETNQSVRSRLPPFWECCDLFESRERYELARRLRSTIGSVFRYAIATARAEFDPTYALRGALTQVKAPPRAAITDAKKFGALLRAIDAFDGQLGTRIALQLLALLFPRPGELRLARMDRVRPRTSDVVDPRVPDENAAAAPDAVTSTGY